MRQGPALTLPGFFVLQSGMDISLTPELESALAERAKRLGTTPELAALHDLQTLYAPARLSDQADGTQLANYLASRIGRTDSRKQNDGRASTLSTDEEGFGSHLEEKRRQGHL